MFILNIADILTMSESSDIEMIMMYQDYVRSSNSDEDNNTQLNRRMGRIGNVRDAKEVLEKIFKKN